MGTAFAAIAVFFLLMAGASTGAHAQSPLAGSSIGNQASATYVDGSAVTRSVSSNVVSTIVQQVAALTITQSLSKTATAGTQVSYPVTLTNTGNGTDSFVLSQSNGTGFFFTSVTFYADANGDGVADNTTPITNTGSLASGAVFRFVAVGNVPTTATSAQSNSLTITALSSGIAGTTPFSGSVIDTTTITTNAVISVSKTMSAVSGASGSGPYTVTLSYNNTGNIAATDVTLTDALPAGMTYVAGSGRWSVTGAPALSDGAPLDGAGPTIDYTFTSPTVKGVINTVAAGQAGTLTFQVNINTGLAAAPLNNVASFAYNDGAAAVAASNTNTFVFTVNQTASVTSDSTPAAPITETNAAQGSTVSFSNVFTNTGNGTDSFDVAISGLLATGTSAFPAGSSFALYKADGVTPLVDTNGNGIPDTGAVAAGASYTVVLKVTLPAGVTGGPFSVSKTATSKFDSTKTATGTDRLTAITANTVDLTNGAGLGVGPFATTGAGTIVTNASNPGTTTRFTLNVVNGSGSTGDTFNLAASTFSDFSSLTLPAGWTVVFRDSTGTVITNTGIVASGATAVVFADVTVPAGQAAIPAGQPITFRALSPSTGSTDKITDSVIVNTIRSVTVTPTNVGQVTPGGSVIYTHTITNAGNVDENIDGTRTIVLSLLETQAGFTSVVYLDVLNNNIIDATDPVINTAANLGLIAAGASKQLLVKVTASSGVGIGVINTTTLTATTSGTINGAPAPATVSTTDATTVISGNIVLLKEQALDADCNGSPESGYSVATITTGAVPGACIRYRVTATNNGSADVLSLVVSDATPAVTTYQSAVAAATTLGTVTTPGNNSAGTISATIGTLTPSASVVLTFGVRINPLP